MNEIKPGSELDRAVAEAIGLTWFDGSRTEMAAWRFGDKTGFKELPKFSTDLNDAFVAAEQVWSEFAVKRLPDGNYEATAFCDGDDGRSRFEEQPTVALAICAAILQALFRYSGGEELKL
jgi:hypothetical protein